MRKNKILVIALLVIMVLMTLVTVVNAATSASLADELYAKGAKYGMTASDKVKIERYIAENPVTDAQASQLIAKADRVIAIMENAGVSNYKDLTSAQKSEVKSIANSAAEIIDVQLVFKKGSVEIYKDGKLIETLTGTNGKLAYTGNSMNVILVVSTISIIALTATVVAKRRIANAR